MTTLHPALFKFLDAIKEENSRKYFASIRPLYDDIRANLQEFIAAMIGEFAKEDKLFEQAEPKKSLFRIYRDARRLKTGDLIYKQNRGAHITPFGKNSEYAGYYLHLQSGRSFLGGGIYRPDSDQLYKLRNFLTEHGDEYYKITNNKKFKSRFGKIYGSSITRLPKGFDKENPYPELIMKKQHLIYHYYTDEEVLSEGFFEQVIADSKIAKPFFDLLNQGLR